MNLDLGLFWTYRIFVLKGIGTTVLLTLTAQGIALILAILTALGRLSDRRMLRLAAGSYVEFVRGTPVLAQVFWVFYCVPIFTGFDWSPLTGAIVALSFNVGAYDAEVFRAGIQSVHHGQVQAARALGLSRFWTFWSIVLPQATRVVLPPLLNNFIGLLLLTSLVSTIGVQELTYVAGKLNVATYQSVAVFTGVAILYLGVSLLSSFGIRRLENVYAKRD